MATPIQTGRKRSRVESRCSTGAVGAAAGVSRTVSLMRSPRGRASAVNRLASAAIASGRAM